MNIVEAYLTDKKKYIILLSGYLWWPNIDLIANTLSKNLNFELIYTYQLVPPNKLITSADQINFPTLNEIVNDRFNKNKEQGVSKGYIIVSYTFPPEKLDFYPDFHININVNSILQTSIIVDLMKAYKVSRLEVDTHISYLSKSWKTNKINKNIIYPPNYLEKQDELYGQIFDSVMDNIMKKVYGEKYDEYKTISNKTSKYPLPKDTGKLIKVADESKMDVSDIQAINRGIKQSEYISDLTDILESSDDEISSEISLNLNASPTLDTDSEILNNSLDSEQINNTPKKSLNNIVNNINSEEHINKVIQEMDIGSSPYYIGKRSINRIINV